MFLLVDVFDTKLGRQVKSHVGSQQRSLIEEQQSVKKSNSGSKKSSSGSRVVSKSNVPSNGSSMNSSFVGPVRPLPSESKPEYDERIQQPIQQPVSPSPVRHEGEPRVMSVSWSAGGSGPTPIPVKSGSWSMKDYTSKVLSDVESVRSRMKEVGLIIKDLKSSGASSDVIQEWVDYKNELSTYAGNAEAQARNMLRLYPTSYVTYEKESVVSTPFGDMPMGGMGIDVSSSDRRASERRSFQSMGKIESSIDAVSKMVTGLTPKQMGRAAYVGFTQWPDIVVSPALRIITSGRERTIWNIGESVKDWQSDIITRESQTWGMVGRGDMGGFATSTLLSPAVMEAGFSAVALGAGKLVGTAFKGIGSKVGSRVVGKGVRGYQFVKGFVPEESLIGRGLSRLSGTSFGSNVYSYAVKGFRPRTIYKGLRPVSRKTYTRQIGDDMFGTLEVRKVKPTGRSRVFMDTDEVIRQVDFGPKAHIKRPFSEPGEIHITLSGKTFKKKRFGSGFDIYEYQGKFTKRYYKSTSPMKIDLGRDLTRHKKIFTMKGMVDVDTGLPLNVAGNIDDVPLLKDVSGMSDYVSSYKPYTTTMKKGVYGEELLESGAKLKTSPKMIYEQIQSFKGSGVSDDVVRDWLKQNVREKTFTKSIPLKKKLMSTKTPGQSKIMEYMPGKHGFKMMEYEGLTDLSSREVSVKMFAEPAKIGEKIKVSGWRSWRFKHIIKRRRPFIANVSGGMSLTKKLELGLDVGDVVKKSDDVFVKKKIVSHEMKPLGRLGLIKKAQESNVYQMPDMVSGFFSKSSKTIGKGSYILSREIARKKLAEPNVIYKTDSISKSRVGLTQGLKPVFMTKSENEFDELFVPGVDTGVNVKSDVNLATGGIVGQRQSMDTVFPPVVYPVSVSVKPVKSVFVQPPVMKGLSGGLVPPVLPFPKGLGGWGTSGYPGLDDIKLKYKLKKFKSDRYRYVSPFSKQGGRRGFGF